MFILIYVCSEADLESFNHNIETYRNHVRVGDPVDQELKEELPCIDLRLAYNWALIVNVSLYRELEKGYTKLR